jgi:HTH-type transcriptional regulator, sugar sensing transcriptional regulator
MNQRHIQDEDYAFKDPLFKILKNNKKDSGTKKHYFSHDDDTSNSSNSSQNNNNSDNNNSDDVDDTIRCVNNIGIENNELIGNLEEFGLSQYEARAYLTMIGKGSLSASEIAYYSHLPRTKIYLTLKKLEKKGLSVISQQKPLICSAINPTEAFEESLIMQEKRLMNMKKVIDKLQKINEKSNYLKGLEEKRYFILDPKSTFQKLSTLIENSRTSIIAILDIWGLRLISQCKSLLIKAITKGVKIKLLISNQCINSEDLSFLPNEIVIKVGNVFSNIIILDSGNIINIDGGNGKAALFPSIDILGFSYMKIFEEEWKKAIEIRNLNKTESLTQLKAVQLIRFIEDLSCFSTFEYLYSIYLSILSSLAINNRSNSSVSSPSPPSPDLLPTITPSPPPILYHNSPLPSYHYSQQQERERENENEKEEEEYDNDENTMTLSNNKKDNRELIYGYNSKFNFNKNHISFLNSLERYGVNLTDFTIEELIQTVDLILKMNYSGELKFDRNNNILSIHSKDKNKSLIILTILLSLYFVNLNYEIDITPKISEVSDQITINTFQIKYSKSLN